MAYDAGLVARVEDALAGLGERAARQRNVFGGRGFLATGSTFAIVYEDELIVKLARADYDRSLTLPGVRPFAPGDERTTECDVGWFQRKGRAVASRIGTTLYRRYK